MEERGQFRKQKKKKVFLRKIRKYYEITREN